MAASGWGGGGPVLISVPRITWKSQLPLCPPPCPSLSHHQALWEENPVKFKKIFRECNRKYWQQEEAAGKYLKWKF